MTCADALRLLLSRCEVVMLDRRQAPPSVTAWTEHGARHFYGATIEAALLQAESGTRERHPLRNQP